MPSPWNFSQSYNPPIRDPMKDLDMALKKRQHGLAAAAERRQAAKLGLEQEQEQRLQRSAAAAERARNLELLRGSPDAAAIAHRAKDFPDVLGSPEGRGFLATENELVDDPYQVPEEEQFDVSPEGADDVAAFSQLDRIPERNPAATRAHLAQVLLGKFGLAEQERDAREQEQALARMDKSRDNKIALKTTPPGRNPPFPKPTTNKPSPQVVSRRQFLERELRAYADALRNGPKDPVIQMSERRRTEWETRMRNLLEDTQRQLDEVLGQESGAPPPRPQMGASHAKLDTSALATGIAMEVTGGQPPTPAQAAEIQRRLAAMGIDMRVQSAP